MKKEKLLELREEINNIDGEILKLFAKRMLIVEEIFVYKKQNDIKRTDMQREKELKLWYKKRAKELNLNPDFFASLFLEVIEEWKKML